MAREPMSDQELRWHELNMAESENRIEMRRETLRLAVSVAPENEHASWTLERAEAFLKYILEGAV